MLEYVYRWLLTGLLRLVRIKKKKEKKTLTQDKKDINLRSLILIRSEDTALRRHVSQNYWVEERCRVLPSHFFSRDGSRLSNSLESGLTAESSRGDADSKKLVNQPILPFVYAVVLLPLEFSCL